jgi:hypothetical protein
MTFSKSIATFGAIVIASCIALAQPAAAQCIPAHFPQNWLQQQEQAGGHTIALHVGKTDAELVQRLQKDPNIQAASTYTDQQTAEDAITAALANLRQAINNWAQNAHNGQRRVDNFAPQGGEVVGRVATRPPGPQNVHDSTQFRTVIQATGGGNCYLLTSFPTG